MQQIDPELVISPGPDQESVWDYPRPPLLEDVPQRVRVELAGHVVADSNRAVRVLETASPPTYYIPPEDVDQAVLRQAPRRSYCEWKGEATYWTLRVAGQIAVDAAWSYHAPKSPYEALRDYVSFYPARVSACYVGEWRVTPQPGQFYGGWITPNLVGPFKGEPGTEHW
jgi:uncharacterized protein (DUF427 family)